MVCLEALSLGHPVVALEECPGHNQLVKDGVNGCLVGFNNAETFDEKAGVLADTLMGLGANPEVREAMSIAGPSSVEEYREDNILNKWVSMIEDLKASRHDL